MLCCNKEMKLIDVIQLQPVGCYDNRELFIFKCRNRGCEAIKYTLKEYDLIKNDFIYDRTKPKKKKNIQDWANSLIKLSRAFEYFEEIQKGNKSNMGFIYGVTTATEQRGYDFNGTLRSRYCND